MKKFGFKKIVGKLHLWLGLASGLIVFIVALTGCVYVFSVEITNWRRSEAMTVHANGERMPATRLWTAAQQQVGEKLPLGNLSVPNDPGKSVSLSSFSYNKGALTYFGAVETYKTVYVNPYSGKVKGIYDEERDFFNIVKFLHWSLLLDTAYGQPIVGWATFVFVVMLITGIILWWPKGKNAARQRFWFRWEKKPKWKRKNYDMHNIPGFWMWPFLIIIAFTGLVWAFTWFQGLVYAAGAGTTEPPVRPNPASDPAGAKVEFPMDVALRHAQAYHPTAAAWNISPAAPTDTTGTIRIYVQQVEGAYYISHEMIYDRYSGKFLDMYGQSDKNFGEKLITANYDIHVGAILGLPGKILAFIASLICASLPVTGFLIWKGRRKKNKKPAKSKTTRCAAEAEGVVIEQQAVQ